MAAQCRSDGGGPWAFGADLSAAPISTNAGAGPYAKALARTTSWSDRVASVELTIAVEDETIGKAHEQALIAALERSGWTRAEDPTTADIGLILIESNTVLRPADSGDTTTAPVFAGVSWYPGELRLICTSAEWTRRDRAEMDGQLPADSPRPAPLPTIAATRPSKASCADPTYVANVDALFGTDARDAWVDQSAMRARQAQRLETWMRWKMLGSGKVSEDQLWELEDRAVSPESDDPGSKLIQGMEMLALMPEIEKAKAAGDTAVLCPLYIRVIDILALEDKRRLDRWARIEQLYLAKAVAAGVDLSR
jgi:hypothetical protein